MKWFVWYLFIFLSFYLFIFLSFYLFVFLSFYLFIFLSFYPVICLSIHPSVFLSICPLAPHSLMVTHHWCEAFASLSLPLAFAPLLKITHLRLGMALFCLVLIFMHEQSFGIVIPFCDLDINIDESFIKETISQMILKSWCWILFFIFFHETTCINLSFTNLASIALANKK